MWGSSCMLTSLVLASHYQAGTHNTKAYEQNDLSWDCPRMLNGML